MRHSVVVCLLAAVVGVVVADKHADMYGGMGDESCEEAPYTVIKTTDNYEIRDYGSPKFVCSFMIANKDGEKKRKKKMMMIMFWNIFGYTIDQNDQGVEIEMGAPMTMQMQEMEDNLYKKQMCFYLPSEYQTNPPMPLDPDVYIDAKQNFKVAVRTFEGWMVGMKQWKDEMDTLMEDLKTAEEPGADLSKNYAGMYKPDMHDKTSPKRNEVWVEIVD